MLKHEFGSSTWLILALPLLAVAQVAAGSLHDLTSLGVSIPERSAANDTDAVPAVYTFSIWGVLFLWSAAFAIFQARPLSRDSRLLAELRGPAALAFAMNCIWEIHAQVAGLGWGSFVIIVGLLLPLLAIVERVRHFDAPIGRSEFWLAVVPLHALAGWISVATFAGLSTTFDATASSMSGLPPVWRDGVLILLAGLVGSFFALRARAPAPYAIAVGWGLVGIILKNVVVSSNPAIAAFATTALIMVVSASRARSRVLDPLALHYPHDKAAHLM